MIDIRELTAVDYDDVISLWESTEGVRLRDADKKENMEQYLLPNPGLSFAARKDGHIVGAVLCGHDGRRGYLHHLAVAKAYRRQGIATALVSRCLAQLRLIGIEKCHLFVLEKNAEAQKFWQKLGWSERTDIKMMSLNMSNSFNI
ncbi:GCN5-related N-acetyltransferase [Microseira wollei NIES-4236]|uniref:GCN5-related N-acetyltransferase n=2 Tax=Microseira wollei TaxID=467598 RepID=A0AAV3XGP7_9CYAN|nr:GCN5-related N-acetyltransferase [Microseira wollei NIES-4236]